MKRPKQLAGPDVEASNVAPGHLLELRTIGNRGVHHHDVARDERRRRDLVVAATGLRADAHGARDPFDQIDLAALAEIGIGLARLGIDRDQVSVARSDKESLVLAVGPVLHAAMLKAGVGGASAFVALGIVDPDRFSRGGIDRGDLTVARGDVEHAVDHERRDLELALAPSPSRTLVHVVIDRGPLPCDLQVADVVAIDLIERRVARRALVPGVMAPLALLRAFLRLSGAGGRERGEDRQPGGEGKPKAQVILARALRQGRTAASATRRRRAR